MHYRLYIYDGQDVDGLRWNMTLDFVAMSLSEPVTIFRQTVKAEHLFTSIRLSCFLISLLLFVLWTMSINQPSYLFYRLAFYLFSVCVAILLAAPNMLHFGRLVIRFAQNHFTSESVKSYGQVTQVEPDQGKKRILRVLRMTVWFMVCAVYLPTAIAVSLLAFAPFLPIQVQFPLKIVFNSVYWISTSSILVIVLTGN
ncbi:hypothetical protein EDD86DRAFT_261572 [Gorgonomyces haynaldii]|nr:hypothetical protein EDD86DRAFT_261572 [Gorgonomyces haynaldii]